MSLSPSLAVGRSSGSRPWPFPGGHRPSPNQVRFSEGGARRKAPRSRLARLAFLGLAFSRGVGHGPPHGPRQWPPREGSEWRGACASRACGSPAVDVFCTATFRTTRRDPSKRASFQTARTLVHVPGTLFSRLIGPPHAPEPVPRPCLRAGTNVSMEPVLACCAARRGISRGLMGHAAMAMGLDMATAHGRPNGDSRSEGLETSGTHDCVWNPSPTLASGHPVCITDKYVFCPCRCGRCGWKECSGKERHSGWTWLVRRPLADHEVSSSPISTFWSLA